MLNIYWNVENVTIYAIHVGWRSIRCRFHTRSIIKLGVTGIQQKITKIYFKRGMKKRYRFYYRPSNITKEHSSLINDANAIELVKRLITIFLMCARVPFENIWFNTFLSDDRCNHTKEAPLGGRNLWKAHNFHDLHLLRSHGQRKLKKINSFMGFNYEYTYLR